MENHLHSAMLLSSEEQTVDKVKALLLTEGFEADHVKILPSVEDGFFYESCPDLVFIDVKKEEVSSTVDFVKKMKESIGGKFIPAILIVDKEFDFDSDVTAPYIDDYIEKPFSDFFLRAKFSSFKKLLSLYNDFNEQKEKLNYYKEVISTEEKVAVKVFNNILKESYLTSKKIKYILSPLSTFNGDMLLAAERPTGEFCVMLGDFTGHGLPAAIGAMPVAQAFYSMIKKGLDCSDILLEVNSKLKEFLPVGIFCSAAFIEIDNKSQYATVWNGGLPDGIVCNRGANVIGCIKSKNLPLGILSSHDFKNTVRKDILEKIKLNYGDRIYLFSDGIIESENNQGIMYGEENLLKVFSAAETASVVFSRIQENLLSFVGNKAQADDITLLELNPFQID